jgi:diaminohydroxyphosphoribosylaminopyrimidine deaminase/5-amino-6-(5-phosphoribosylamino)uracil reductase
MEDINENILWELLLMLRNYVRKHKSAPEQITVIYQSGQFELIGSENIEIPKDSRGIFISLRADVDAFRGFTIFHSSSGLDFTVPYNDFLNDDQCRFLKLYLPVCFLPMLAKKFHRTATVLHLAQTLDGRIATATGDSKWISNPEDLIHAHRMRALCDAVLIGANTLRIDKPHLTVRHVKGPDPLKVVLGNEHVEFGSLLEDGGEVLYLTSAAGNGYHSIRQVRVPSEEKNMDPKDILSELYGRAIYSVYVEGGSGTASCFLQEGAADIIQLFMSPKIFGSGLTGFSLPDITRVENSISFHQPTFVPMGDGILFYGKLKE